MQIEITAALISLVAGFASSFIFYVAVVVKKFATIEAEMAGVKMFHSKLMDRMIDLTIDVTTPELDKLLLAFKRGEKLTNEDWKELNNYLEHYHVEAMKEQSARDPARKIAMAFLLAAVEARRATEQRKENRLWRRLFRRFF